MSNCKYYKQQKYVSYDGGFSWSAMDVYQKGALIESGSTDCGSPTPPTPTPSYSGQYLTFVATESGTFKCDIDLWYSLDSGTTWTSLASNTNSPTVSAGNKIMWKNSDTYGAGYFSSTNNFTAEGNVMSLVYGDDFVGQTSLEGYDTFFEGLFLNCSGLTSAENLILPATTLAGECYIQMFHGCTNLTTPPQLPATTLANACYFWMFGECTSLTTAPELPATTLASGCYSYMFQNCKSLTTAPVLSAATIDDYCYADMFEGCSNLNSVTCLATSGIGQSNSTLYWLSSVSLTGTFVRDCNTTWPSGDSGIPSGWTDNCSSPTPSIEGILVDYANPEQFTCCMNLTPPLIGSGSAQTQTGISYNVSTGYYRIGSIPFYHVLPIEADSGEQHTDTWSLTSGNSIYSITFILQERCLSNLQTALSGNTTITNNYNIYVGQPSGVNIPLPESDMYPSTNVTCELKSGGTAQTSISASSTERFRISKIYIQYYTS